jgi:predicted Zn-dependent protease
MAGQSRKQQIEAMLESDPSDPFLRYALALEHVSAGEDQAAAEQFQRLLHEHPDYVAGYFHFGQTMARLGWAGKAKELLARGIAVAEQAGDLHAAEEMRGLLGTL